MTPDQDHRHASDIRTALTIIKSHAQLGLRHLGRAETVNLEQLSQRLHKIEESVERAVESVESWIRETRQ